MVYKTSRTLLPAMFAFTLAAVFLSSAAGTSLSSAQQEGAHHWPHVRGHVGSYGTTPLLGPANLNSSLAWSFHHPDGRYHGVMLGGAIIDKAKNIYVAMDSGIYKLSPTGEQLWIYKENIPYSNVPSIEGDALFCNSLSGHSFALDLATGSELWVRKHTDAIGGDTAYVEAYGGVVVHGSKGLPPGGNQAVVGLNASNGDLLWEYQRLVPVWNVMGVFPGDDTVVFMHLDGGATRLGLHNGTEIWHSGPILPSITDGGLLLGPEGDVYTCSNAAFTDGNEGQAGFLRKYALKDGELLWQSPLPYPCNSWPAISADGASVVVVPGSFVQIAPTAAAMNANPDINLTAFHDLMMELGEEQRNASGEPELRAAIMSLDAATGQEIWQHEVKPWGQLASAGDEEGILVRQELGIRENCWPAHWSSPTIDGSGVVYVGRTNGMLYRYSPASGESTYTTGTGPLHSGTTFAPGMMAYTDCDSLYVFDL